MTNQTYNEIVTPELAEGAIPNREFHGFYEDYMVLHCLIRKHKPKTLYEIGTNHGSGTKILKNAAGSDCVVFSLDLPTELIHHSLNPKNGKDNVGKNCDLPYVQLRGDSMTFDFSKYSCEAYYVDGNHTEESVNHETVEILKLNPNIVIYHDTDIPEVLRGVVSGWSESGNKDDYELFRVTDTRVSYLLKVK